MKFSLNHLWDRPWFERLYVVTIVIKGFDGLVEFVAGVAILIAPHLVHTTLDAIVHASSSHPERPFQFIAQNVGGVDADLAKGGLIFLTLFLIVHGAVKLGLVYCLLKRITRAYPIALIILVIFLIYQVYVLIMTPSIFMVFFTALDIVIIWLVWNEYQELQSKAKKDGTISDRNAKDSSVL